jgi:phage tail protein X
MKTILTKDKDILDALCYKHYGREALVPQVLEANPHLAKLPVLLPAGVLVYLPDIEEQQEKPEVRLWE